mmetsp:Transcript_13154/g.37034  ORF Transcript_13154/g.37034 Transcript_13154/m.37034 type:complete len:342 (+) Transcript_13154:243-1268(+)
MFGNMGMYGGGGVFQQNYRCYPVTFIDKAHLEEGNKVILPPSALDRLAMLHIDYPMLFKIENRKSAKTSNCGVLEFVADEGMVYMPYWMMQNLLLSEGDIVNFKSATLPKGKFVKLQPHTKDFLDISNPKAVLERTLRNYSCLTVGDTILVPYNNKNYYIDIIEAKPQDAVSIVETDCEVDFAPPLDYVEPEPQPPAPQAPPLNMGSARPTSGSKAEAAAAPEPEPEPTFLAFSGQGARLDGKAAAPSAPVPVPMAHLGSSMQRSASNTSVASSSGSGAADANGENKSSRGGAAKPLAGKLVFGSSGPGAPKPQTAKTEEKEEANQASRFSAFSGKSYSLK